ncbi:MAG: hypothetical protein KatS3mg014_2538 [Actinomycetota bacterium]|nr:MAG: hypothetical protein KatS3mg014_2467 [Actinomycetota bacterium]GIV00923.1 MAG: hypothetical protein KatS3mg014_2538 [Actinomycetota bacterium]
MTCQTCSGPCSLWCDPLTLPCTTPSATEAVRAATEWLYRASGRQFPGCCSAVLRPTPEMVLVDADPYGLREHNARTSTRADLGLSGWTGRKLWGYPAIDLGVYPVISVDEVRIDGSVLAASAYRLVDKRLLIRVDGGDWPSSNDLALSSGPGAWSVSVTYGRNPPLLGELACRQLACEIAASMEGAPCNLPAGATVISREGVTISISPDQVTGLFVVDQFLRAYNPSKLRRAPDVWSPDVPGPEVHVV